REMCSYPLYVNDIADTVKMVQKYPNPCSPSFVRTFIFRVEKETVVNIKLGLPSRDSVVTILHKSLSEGYYKLTFPGINSDYITKYINTNRKTAVEVLFIIDKKLFSFSLFRG
ncbi:MAG: hypothetical protein R6W90_01190, partial [Ignavibacteriaceae bacterium]